MGEYVVSLAPFVEEAIFSPAHVLGSLVKNQMIVVVWICVCVFCSIGPMSVFNARPCCFYCYGSVVQFEVWYCDTFSVALFVFCISI
jgi:hypothetical protein